VKGLFFADGAGDVRISSAISKWERKGKEGFSRRGEGAWKRPSVSLRVE